MPLQEGEEKMKRKEELPECPIATTVSLIGSKWKLLIVQKLIKSTLSL